MLHVVADENMPAVDLFLGDAARVTFCNGRSLHADDLADADALFVRSVTRVDEALLAGSPVRYVGTATSGTEHVDLKYLASRGIGFSRAAGSNANSVVEYVLSALAAHPAHLKGLMAGGTVGVVGQGPVGRAVANRLEALGATCRRSDPWLSPQQLSVNASLDEVLSCDVICLHPELTRTQPWPSYHLLGERELQRLGEQQLLINASRGPVVDNAALRRRLAEPAPPRVVLDVWEDEPDLDTGLLDAVDLGTAHIAGYSLDAKILATRMLCEDLADYLEFSLPQAVPLQIPSYSVSGDLQGAALVGHLVRQCYDVCEDDRRLRQACANGGAVGAAFDQLRRHYPERRELAGSEVAGCSDSQLETLRALGCKPV